MNLPKSLRCWRTLLLVTGYWSLVTVSACRVTLSPVKNRLGIGVESYVFFDAAGEAGQGDLYAGSASGGKVFRVTFSRVHEARPALSPDGGMLAFLRGVRADDSASYRVWVMNLLNGAEREIALPAGARPTGVAWSPAGDRLYVSSSAGPLEAAAPPAPGNATAVAPARAGLADTLLGVPLGEPVMALAMVCDSGGGICARSGSGVQRLASLGRAPFRWGADSVGYFTADGIDVRPLGGGTVRSLRWSEYPEDPRTATAFPGTVVEPVVPGLRP